MSDDQDIVRLFRPAPWVTLAACRGLPVSMFHPEKHDSISARNAREVCTTCPVREQCLLYSLDENIRDGIWGGLSERQRRPLRKARWHLGACVPAIEPHDGRDVVMVMETVAERMDMLGYLPAGAA